MGKVQSKENRVFVALSVFNCTIQNVRNFLILTLELVVGIQLD